MTSIILVSGSLRRDSLNSSLVATARRVIGERDTSVRTFLLDVGAFPFFSQDLEVEDAPPPVAAARRLVETADAMLVSTPEYNGAPPGVLKNAIDWLSRPPRQGVLTGMPVATMSASTGSGGAADSQELLRDVLECTGAAVLEHPLVAVAEADLLPCRGGEFVDPALSAVLAEVVEALLAAARPESAVGASAPSEGPLKTAGTSAA